MTVIEFFDKTAIENVLSALVCEPEQVIFVGDNGKRMKKSIAAYQQVLQERCLNVQMRYRSVGKNDLGRIVETLSQIVEENQECVFNLDGGEDLYLVAVGMVAQRYGSRVQLHRFNVRNNTAIDCDADGNDQQVEPIAVKIWENVRIYGGRVIYEDERSGATQRWTFHAEFCRDVRAMWQVCRVNPRQWNWVLGQLDKLCSMYPAEDPAGLDVYIPYTPQVVANHSGCLPQLRLILGRLEKAGVILNLREDAEGLGFSYKDAQIRQSLSKAGTMLELYIAVTAGYLVEDDERVYNDAMSGVYLDWDGVVQDENQADVTNEIDVMLMHGAIPVFISCKNGDLEIDELYKLNTVAERFGGKYAKKVLVVSSLDELGTKSEYIRLRAKEMGVRIVEDVDGLEEPELERILCSLWRN